MIVVDGIEVGTLNYAQREELAYDVKAQMVEQRAAVKRALSRANILRGAINRMTEELHVATAHAKDCAEREEELRVQLEAMAVEMLEQRVAIKRALSRANILRGAINRMTEEFPDDHLV